VIPTTSNYIEKIDDTTFKQLCKTCGGKTFYIHQFADYDTRQIYKTEIVNCENCEGGFVYGKKS